MANQDRHSTQTDYHTLNDIRDGRQLSLKCCLVLEHVIFIKAVLYVGVGSVVKGTKSLLGTLILDPYPNRDTDLGARPVRAMDIMGHAVCGMGLG